ncbi:hypothetical protein GALMADRAFT_139002 [Galerina marginata CBS 339.88]|uniref:F-box domain-containing protein n=1 Tax=Galerina marginata (strain CBS 339.88) TaxID=685588 RepID=A0A067T1D5_GALM3|nr:hypothetical protein GALMADRAFT_139002 [Galerina marginata CBS 339.88]
MAQSSSVSMFSDLPTELVVQILQALDDDSLVQLSLTCRNLHFMALDLFFSKTDIDTSRGWLLVTDDPPAPTVRALRCSLKLQDLQKIYFAFTPDFQRLFRDMDDLRGLLARLPSIHIVTLQFGGIDNWAYDLLRSKTRCIEAATLKRRLTGLMDVILEKSCEKLHVLGLTKLSQLYIESTVVQPGPEGAAYDVSSHKIIKEPRSFGLTTRDHEGSGPRHQEAIASRASDTPKQGRMKISLVLPIKLFFRKVFLSFRRKRSKVPLSDHPSLLNNIPSHIEGNDTIRIHNEHPFTLPRLMPREIYLSQSNILFEPPLYGWTISTLKAECFNINTLSFQSLELPTTVWAKLLRSLDLPNLKKFQIYSTWLGKNVDASFLDIYDFLLRHRNITDLHFHTTELPSSNNLVKSPVLPLLRKFTAHPFYINWMLQCSVLEGRTFQHLHSVTISAEHSSIRFDYDLFDTALQTVGNAPNAVLTLGFVSNSSGVERWFTKHVDLGAQNSVISSLTKIASLEISLSFSMGFCDDILALFPRWLCLFPKLEHLEFTTVPLETKYRLKGHQFVGKLAMECPNLKTLTVHSEEFRLDSFRRAN